MNIDRFLHLADKKWASSTETEAFIHYQFNEKQIVLTELPQNTNFRLIITESCDKPCYEVFLQISRFNVNIAKSELFLFSDISVFKIFQFIKNAIKEL